MGSNYDTVHAAYQEHIRSISDGWLRFPVGQFYSYSNQGLDLVGFMLAKKAGVPIEDYLTQKLLTPLAMLNSTYHQEQAYAGGNLAKVYYGNTELKKTYIADVAAGGLYSNAADMARFLSYQLADCRMNGKMTISRELLTQMHTVQFKLAGQQAGYGLGVMIKPFHGATFLYHPDGGYGYSAALAFIPEARIGIVILTNSAEGYTFNQQILQEALEAMLTVKTGALKPKSKPTVLPAVRLSKFSLNTLKETYKMDRKLVEIRQAACKLVLVSGFDTSYFTANSRVKL